MFESKLVPVVQALPADSSHDMNVVPLHPRHVELVTVPEKRMVRRKRAIFCCLKKSVTTQVNYGRALSCYVNTLVQRVEDEVE